MRRFPALYLLASLALVALAYELFWPTGHTPWRLAVEALHLWTVLFAAPLLLLSLLRRALAALVRGLASLSA
ncbi:MAG: hypothetical protein KDG89_12550 [Geminicoccaceae bacterium]|nr:hypothetical protein [Geminicoccaceae bacterium]